MFFTIENIYGTRPGGILLCSQRWETEAKDHVFKTGLDYTEKMLSEVFFKKQNCLQLYKYQCSNWVLPMAKRPQNWMCNMENLKVF